MCQQPYNVDTAMIECDLCNEWYHLKCIGLTQVRASSIPGPCNSTAQPIAPLQAWRACDTLASRIEVLCEVGCGKCVSAGAVSLTMAPW